MATPSLKGLHRQLDLRHGQDHVVEEEEEEEEEDSGDGYPECSLGSLLGPSWLTDFEECCCSPWPSSWHVSGSRWPA